MSKRKELEQSHAAELSSYLRYKKRIFESTEISDTDSSVSEGEVKRKRTLNYFGGNGEKQWDPKSMFVVNGLNATKLFLKFRNRNIILAEKVNCINSVRILALKNGLRKYAYEDVNINKVNMEAVNYCKQLIDAIDESQDIGEIEYSPTNTIDIHMKEAVLEFIDIVAESNQSSESTFTDKYILPFVRKVLLKKSDVEYSIADGHDKKSGKKPDIKIGFKDKKKVIDVIYFEVKRPNVASKYQAEDDYVKLLKQLKTSIDYQVKLNIISPVAFGVHCKGFDCSFIQMKVIEDGVYLATTLRKFRLPKDTISLLDIPRVVECFEFMLDELEKVQSRYKERVKKTVTIEHKYVKKSFVTEFS